MERFLLTFLLLADLEEFLGGLFHLTKEKPIVNSLCTVFELHLSIEYN